MFLPTKPMATIVQPDPRSSDTVDREKGIAVRPSMVAAWATMWSVSTRRICSTSMYVTAGFRVFQAHRQALRVTSLNDSF